MSERAANVTGPSRKLWTTLKDDVRVVADDIQRRGVRRSVSSTLTSLEAFYLTEDDRRQLAALPRFRRSLRRIWWFIVSLLMKLTPARRVLLALALIFTVSGGQRIDVGSVHVNLGYGFPGGLLLLVLLTLELKDKLVARDELEAGRAVQLALMPTRNPRVPGWDIWLYTQPANDVGGDLVDHLQIDERRHFVALGDVAGKALPAALLSVKLQATLRALAPSYDDLGALGGAVNHILQRDGLPSRFASLVYLLLTEREGHVRLLNAGHMPPLLVRATTVTTLERGSMVLGMMPGATFLEQQLDLVAGDTLIVYSDGVSEAMKEAGDFFGDERLSALATETAGQPIGAIGRRVLGAVSAFIGELPPNDDVSLIVVRRTSPDIS